MSSRVETWDFNIFNRFEIFQDTEFNIPVLFRETRHGTPCASFIRDFFSIAVRSSYTFLDQDDYAFLLRKGTCDRLPETNDTVKNTIGIGP